MQGDLGREGQDERPKDSGVSHAPRFEQERDHRSACRDCNRVHWREGLDLTVIESISLLLRGSAAAAM